MSKVLIPGDRVQFSWAGGIKRGWVVGRGDAPGTWAVLFNGAMDVVLHEDLNADRLTLLEDPPKKCEVCGRSCGGAKRCDICS